MTNVILLQRFTKLYLRAASAMNTLAGGFSSFWWRGLGHALKDIMVTENNNNGFYER